MPNCDRYQRTRHRKNKVRQDLGITYDMDVLRLRNEFQQRGFMVSSVVITHYNGQISADSFRSRLERMGITTYYHYTIEGYPNNVGLIASDEGFGNNDYIVTTRPLVIVTAPDPAAERWQCALASFTTSTSAALKPDMLNLKHSPCGIFR